MFCAPEKMIYRGAHGEHGAIFCSTGVSSVSGSQTRTRAGCPFYSAILRALRALRALRGESQRFTRLNVALRHLTLLDLFIDSPKRTHRGRACGQSPVGPTIGTRRRIAYWSRVRLAVWRPSFRWRGVRAHNKLLHARVLTV